jgi:hypothetical protein
MAEQRLPQPMMAPVHRRVCCEEWGLILKIKKGRKTLMKLKEKFEANCEKEMKIRLRRCAAIRKGGLPTTLDFIKWVRRVPGG